ncbi:MAG: hypothetical protein HYR84_08840 [Planctomycetes bacterium]|nr:hypothetical protein [Planctomycetota bacterium]
MAQPMDYSTWWQLHLRTARGESLSAREQREYDSEMARQDRDAAPLVCDLETLKKLRSEASALGKANGALRQRLVTLEEETRQVERALGQKTRAALGVQD